MIKIGKHDPDHVIVCGERVERHSVGHEHATYGHPLAVVRVAYWPAHDRQWSAHLARVSNA